MSFSFHMTALLFAFSIATANAQDIQAVAEKIRTSERIPSESNIEAFRFVLSSYSKDPQATPPEIQKALLDYLSTVAKSDVSADIPTDLEPETLPIWTAVLHSSPDANVHGAIADRHDLPLSTRLKSVEKLKKGGMSDSLTSVGRTLMKNEDRNDKYIAAYAFTSLEEYPPEAASFLIRELASDKPSRIPVIFESNPEQIKKLYRNLDPPGKNRLSDFVKSKHIKIQLEGQ